MILLSIEKNSKESTKTATRITKWFRKVRGNKVNTQKTNAYLYTNYEQFVN